MAITSMITSKNIIDKTGISRATLNNYIKLGILPKPVVGPPRPEDKGVKQIGYFPEEVLSRIGRVRLLKGQGRSMEDIARLFGERGGQLTSTDSTDTETGIGSPGSSGLPSSRSYIRSSDSDLKVTVSDISTPAYLVNRNFEVEWINKQAEDLIFGKKVRGLVDIESRNIFKLFLGQRMTGQSDDWIDLASLHLTVLQKNISAAAISSLCRGITGEEVKIFRDLFESRRIVGDKQVLRLPVNIGLPSSVRKNYWVHTMTFREGTFFVYLPAGNMDNDLLSMLDQRERVIDDLLRHRMPSLVSLCVLVADLQDSVRICSELLPAQYFELINGLWDCVGPALEKHHGITGKHVGDGMLCYFVDKPGDNYMNNCISCAIELREIVKKFSNKWKGIKGWDNDLYLNTGINEGEEFFGTIHSANNIEFTALGDTINIGARLSEFAHNGEIWTTKNLISKLSQEERNTLRFGVHSRKRPGNSFIRDSFSRLSDLITEDNSHYQKLTAIAGLPVTEIKDRVFPEFD